MPEVRNDESSSNSISHLEERIIKEERKAEEIKNKNELELIEEILSPKSEQSINKSRVNINIQSSMINDTIFNSPPKNLKGSLNKYANKIKGYLYEFCISNSFSFSITFCVIFNTVILALDKFPEDEDTNKTYDTIDTVLTWIFFGEMLIKIFGIGPA